MAPTTAEQLEEMWGKAPIDVNRKRRDKRREKEVRERDLRRFFEEEERQ